MATPSESLTALPEFECLTTITANNAVKKRRSLAFFGRRSQDAPTADLSRRKTWKSNSRKFKLSHQSDEDLWAGTIIHAVPSTSPQSGATSGPYRLFSAPSDYLIVERSAAPSPNTEILQSIAKKSSTSRFETASYFTDISPSSINSAESGLMSPGLASPGLKQGPPPYEAQPLPAIGTYKNGKMYWGQVPPSPSKMSAAGKTRRPKIQVAIPEEQNNRPTGPMQFYKQRPALRSAKVDLSSPIDEDQRKKFDDDESLPPGYTVGSRGSSLSPLASHPKVHRFAQAQPKSEVAKYVEKLNKLHAANLPVRKFKRSTSYSSATTNEGDDSSQYSQYSGRSSMTSVEETNERLAQIKAESSPHQRSASAAFSIISPIKAGVFDSSASIGNASADSESVDASAAILGEEEASGTSDESALSSSQAQAKAQILPEMASAATQPPTPPQNPVSLSQGQRSRSRSPSMVSLHRYSGIEKLDRRGSNKRRSAARLELFGALIDGSGATYHDSTLAQNTSRPVSITLSEAEHDLHKHLSVLTEDESPFLWDDIIAHTALPSDDDDELSRLAPSITADDTVHLNEKVLIEAPKILATPVEPAPLFEATPPPPVPRKSSRRKSISPTSEKQEHVEFASAVQRAMTTMMPHYTRAEMHSRNASSEKRKGLKINIPKNIPVQPRSRSRAPTMSPRSAIHERMLEREREISSAAAEVVILNILEQMNSLEDLYNIAVVNQGFYRVFKRHELRLMRKILRRHSPAAWEYMEMCPPLPEGTPNSAVPVPEYTPQSYSRTYRRGMAVIRSLKRLILTRCLTFLRPETVAALQTPTSERSARVNDAFWRLWTFCKVFGCNKGREEDVVAQQDWLRGGEMFHQQTCATFDSRQSVFDISTLMASVPESFAQGNQGGLDAEQLYDMTELWTCLSVLLQALSGKTDQARKYGIFDNADVEGGDVDREELLLEEWHYYLLTLGLGPVLALASPSKHSAMDAFEVAQREGWVEWYPPTHGGSRSTFLKEAVARVYEERVIAMANLSPMLRKQEALQAHRERIAEHQMEIRTRKASGDGRKVTMSMERPMSVWAGILAEISTSPDTTDAPPVPDLPAAFQGLQVQVPKTPKSKKPAPLTLASSSHHRQPSAAQLTYLRRAPTSAANQRAELFSPTSSAPPTSASFLMTHHFPISEEDVPPPTPPKDPHYIQTPRSAKFSKSIRTPSPRQRPTITTRHGLPTPNTGSTLVDNSPSTPIYHGPIDKTPPTPDLAHHPAFASSPSPYDAPLLITRPATTTGTRNPHHRPMHSESHRPVRKSPSSTTLSHQPSSASSSHTRSSSQPHPKNQHPLQHSLTSPSHAGENSAERAIFRLVEMGFTAEEARHALRVTDLGDGLDLGRAVGVLLRMGEIRGAQSFRA